MSKEWYVVHTYSGYENKVKTDLEKRVQSMGMEDKIFTVVVPTEEALEDTPDGKKKMVTRKRYPGYVFVEMTMSDESYYLVRSTPGVTGFVGTGSKPDALRPSEVRRILPGTGDDRRYVSPFKVGQTVRITESTFRGFTGVIEEIAADREKVRVRVSMFNRETPVELNFNQVEEI
jgi:transcriptional antiterminator NusG